MDQSERILALGCKVLWVVGRLQRFLKVFNLGRLCRCKPMGRRFKYGYILSSLCFLLPPVSMQISCMQVPSRPDRLVARDFSSDNLQFGSVHLPIQQHPAEMNPPASNMDTSSTPFCFLLPPVSMQISFRQKPSRPDPLVARDFFFGNCLHGDWWKPRKGGWMGKQGERRPGRWGGARGKVGGVNTLQ